MLSRQIEQAVKHVKLTSAGVVVNDVKKMTDLALLDEKADESKLRDICNLAVTNPPCAAVCVFPVHIGLCKQFLSGSTVKIAAVINFPSGEGDSKVVRREIDEAIMSGAHELDIVFPYQTYLENKALAYKNFERVFEHVAKRAYTKVIIEVGAFTDMEMIYDLTCGLIDIGANMIKTSTGTFPKGPTLESAAAILFGIKNYGIGATTGLKISGGIRTCKDAAQYARLYQNIVNRDWRNKTRLRFGASQLIVE